MSKDKMEDHKLVLSITELLMQSLSIGIERIDTKYDIDNQKASCIPVALSRFIYREMAVYALSQGISMEESKNTFIVLFSNLMNKNPESII